MSTLNMKNLFAAMALMFIALHATAQITGPTAVYAGVNYDYTFTDGTVYPRPNWTITGGTKITNSSSGSNYYVTIQWTSSGSVSFKDGPTVIATLNVTVCNTPAPTGTFTYGSNCTVATITRNGTPPANTTWYWQTTTTGTSTTNGTANYTTTQPGTYYLRARETNGCWSTPVLATAAIPATPTSPNVNICYGTSTTLNATPGADGNTVRWYHQCDDKFNVLATSTSFNTPVLTANKSYYIATYNSTTGAESIPVQVTVTVNPVSVGGTVSSSASVCAPASGALILSGRTGSVQRWEQNTGSGWTTIANTTDTLNYSNVNVTTQYRAVVKSGACAEATSTTATLTTYSPAISVVGPTALVYGSQTQLTTASYPSYDWKKDNASISTQQTIDVTSVGSYTVTVPVITGLNCTSAPVNITGMLVNQPVPVNMVSTTVVKKSGVTDASQLYALQAHEVAQVVNYQDGLGRTFQTIGVGLSPGKGDVVNTVVYGRNGLVDSTYLPYTTSSPDGRIRQNAIRVSGSYTAGEQYQFYQGTAKVASDQYPYARTVYRDAPDARVTEVGGTGAEFQTGGTHTVRSTVTLNTTSYPVRNWKADGTTTGNYPAKTVMVGITTDGNGNKVRTFTDALGRTVLKQVQLDDSIGNAVVAWLETYYIYDDFGRLKYQLPPKALNVLGTGSSLDAKNASVASLIYTYSYDSLNRLKEKKVPDAAPQYFVYDKLDRLVLMQDGNLRSRNQWMFFKYDRRNRVVYTGLYASASSRHTLQLAVNAIDINTNPYYETEQQNATYHGYSNTVWPTTGLTVLGVNYYDHYDLDRNGSATEYTYDNAHLSGIPAAAHANLTGLATASKKVIIDGAGNVTTNWLTTVNFYDSDYRVVQTQANNHLNLAGLDKSSILYDQTGRVDRTYSSHTANAVTTNIQQRYEYDHAGRVLKVHHKINSNTEVQVAQYEYNALGQVVDKKLHHTGSGNFLQSVDYRYAIQGALLSINNAKLDSVATSDETNDLFGMELLYHQTDSIQNVPQYNGGISGVKWKGAGMGKSYAGRRSYNYSYDKSDRLKQATFKAHSGSAWTKEANALNEKMTYDHNGNIATLKRYNDQRGLDVVNSLPVVTSTPQLMDNLAYTYATGNQLSKVEDTSGNDAGFKNGANIATEYRYTLDGSMASDENKGIDTVIYNVLGKVQQVVYADKTISYTYDAAGNKLKMAVTGGASTTTDYTGGFVYENNTMSFFGSPEGRVVKNGSTFEYQYSIADHQGNTRVVFSSVTPAPTAPVATFEGDAGDQAGQYLNVANVEPFLSANHTTGGSKVVRMNQNYKTGPAKSLKVYAGDKVDMEVGVYYESDQGYGTTTPSLTTLITNVAGAFGGASGGAGESGKIFDAVNNALGFFGTGGNQGDEQPGAYLNYILFDQQYNVLDAGWEAVPTSANFAKQKISIDTKKIEEAGYMFVYLSYENESNNYVYFDDFKVTHTKSNVVQYNEYYAFGLQTAASWTRDNSTNNYLYNAGSELNKVTGNYEMFFRGYDPALARMMQVDPMADKYSSLTPYNYAFNSPVVYNDPRGDDPDNCSVCLFNKPQTGSAGMYNRMQSRKDGGSGGWFSALNQDWWGPKFLGLDKDGHSIHALPSAIERAGGPEKYVDKVNKNKGRTDEDDKDIANDSFAFEHEGLKYGVRVASINGKARLMTMNRIRGNGSELSTPELIWDAETDGQNWVDDFLEGAANAETDMLVPSGLLAGWGAITEITNKAVRNDARFYTRFANLRKVAKASKLVTAAGKYIGVGGVLLSGVESFTDKDGFTWGDGAKLLVGAGATALTIFGAPVIATAAGVYGLVDLGFAIFTDSSLTDRLGAGIDNMIKNR